MLVKFKKRDAQKLVKEMIQSKPVFKFISRVNFLASLLLSFAAKRVFAENPHAWHEITNRLDLLLIAGALLFSLMNVYITAHLNFLDVLRGEGYLGRFGRIKMMMTLGKFVLPFLFAIYSLITIHELYTIPLIAVVVTHMLHAHRPRRTQA